MKPMTKFGRNEPNVALQGCQHIGTIMSSVLAVRGLAGEVAEPAERAAALPQWTTMTVEGPVLSPVGV